MRLSSDVAFFCRKGATNRRLFSQHHSKGYIQHGSLIMPQSVSLCCRVHRQHKTKQGKPSISSRSPTTKYKGDGFKLQPPAGRHNTPWRKKSRYRKSHVARLLSNLVIFEHMGSTSKSNRPLVFVYGSTSVPPALHSNEMPRTLRIHTRGS